MAPISVIARQLNTIRDDFIAELFDEMKAEIRGLNHDARMTDLWRREPHGEHSLTTIHYLERDGAGTRGMDAPRAALAYAMAGHPRSAMFRCRCWCVSTRKGLSTLLRVAMQYRIILEPQLSGCPRSSSWSNHSNRVHDEVADPAESWPTSRSTIAG